MGSLDTQFFPSLALQPWACSLSCSWGRQVGLHISGSVALAGCLASLSMGLSQVSTVKQEDGWGHGASTAHMLDEQHSIVIGHWANGMR